MIEVQYNHWAVAWEQELAKHFPQTTWRVHDYLYMIQHGYVYESANEWLPTGVFVEGIVMHWTAVRFLQVDTQQPQTLNSLPLMRIMRIGKEIEAELQRAAAGYQMLNSQRGV